MIRAIFLTTLLFFSSSFLYKDKFQQQIHFDNVYYYNNQNGQFTWSIFVAENVTVLSKINYVNYYLDPSFNKGLYGDKPITVYGNNFSLCRSGASEFNLKIEIGYQNSEILHTIYHLDLHTNNKRRSNNPCN
jgi:hypothetical protein